MSWDVASGFFFRGLGLPFVVYVVLQIVAPFFVHRWKRLAVLIPAPFMAWTLVAAIDAYLRDSNLWPIFLVILSPFAILFIGIVGWVDYLEQNAQAGLETKE